MNEELVGGNELKKIALLFVMFLFPLCVFATEEADLVRYQTIQQRIDDIGAKILNANKIEQRVVFLCSEKDKKQSCV